MREKFAALVVAVLSVFMFTPAATAAGDTAPYGTAKVDMHTKMQGINTVFDVNLKNPARLSAVYAVAKNVMNETHAKVIFVFHGKEQIAFANKNQEQYSDIMKKMAELKHEGVDFKFCNNAMKGNGLAPEDMNGLVTVVPAGYPELAYWQTQGYKYLYLSAE
ncbi:MAG: DsrE family protein [Betaproteobacteria bacterium]|nr:DsrE family protein [Betaproteobacteria bacterium]